MFRIERREELRELESCALARALARDDRPASQAASPRERLLVVLTTHARPSAATRVLGRLQSGLGRPALASYERALCVIEDSSDSDYTAARAALCTPSEVRVSWLKTPKRYGKAGFARIWQATFELAERFEADHLLVVQDDLDFDDALIERALALSRALRARRRLGARFRVIRWPARGQVLSLFSTRDDERFGRWVFFPRQRDKDLPLERTQWFDLPAVLFDRAALDALEYTVFPIAAARWKKDPSASSGVGRQLTRRLCLRAHIHQCRPSLVFHGAEPSAMNPEARTARALDNRGDSRTDERTDNQDEAGSEP